MNEEYDFAARSLFESLLSKSFETESESRERPSAVYRPPLEGIDASELPLLEEEDRDIFMHRDAHFGSSFPLMLEHYEEEGIGAVLNVDLRRIARLCELEEQFGQNLAPYLLQGADAEKIAQSLRLYQALREQAKMGTAVEAIADLILSEEEHGVVSSKAALFGPKITPYLIQLIKEPMLYDPLLPGYGQAPIRAIMALGKLRAFDAIKPLFELIGSENFDVESASLQALSQIGKPAKDFCLAQLASRPITKNNERAAILASSLEPDSALAEVILRELEDPEVQARENLATYLVLACWQLPKGFHDRMALIAKNLPDSVQEEMQAILKKC